MIQDDTQDTNQCNELQLGAQVILHGNCIIKIILASSLDVDVSGELATSHNTKHIKMASLPQPDEHPTVFFVSNAAQDIRWRC